MIPLRQYQEVGADFLAGQRYALLADEAGIGKTAEAVAACDRVGAKRILVICPPFVCSNWAFREFPRFSDVKRPAKVLVDRDDWPLDDGVTVVSWALLRDPLVKALLRAKRWDVIVVDECHKFGDPDSQRTRALYGNDCSGIGGVVEAGDRVWVMSGTPMLNHHGNLYPMLRAFGRWDGSYAPFLEKFVTAKWDGRKLVVVANRNAADLKNLLKPIMLRRRAADVLKDMPTLSWDEVMLDQHDVAPEHLRQWLLFEKRASLRKRILDALAVEPFDMSRIENRYIAEYRRVTGIVKAGMVKKHVEMLLQNSTEKLVVFTVHRYMSEYLLGHFRTEYRARLIYGGHPMLIKERRRQSFINNDRRRLLILNIAAAGEGMDGLQEVCHRAVFAEMSWSAAENAQAIRRLLRLGQRFPVMAQYLTMANSLDEHVVRIVQRKSADAFELFDKEDVAISTMSC